MSRVKGSASRGETFLEMVKANFIAAREIMIEFVFSLCENGCVPGSVTAPHRTDSIIRLTRGRPGERFFVRGGLAITRVGAAAFGVRWEAQRHTAFLSSAFAGIASHFTLCALEDHTCARKRRRRFALPGAVQNEEAPLALNHTTGAPPS